MKSAKHHWNRINEFFSMKYTYDDFSKMSNRGKVILFSPFFPHYFIERFHAGDEVKNKHLTFSYKRQGILILIPRHNSILNYGTITNSFSLTVTPTAPLIAVSP